MLRVFLVAILGLLLGAARAQPAPEGKYRVGAGDVLQVKVFGEASLSGAMPVDDAGQLDFPLLGPVAVGGMTPPEIAAYLRVRLQDGFILDPQVSVWVDRYGSQPIQVLGAVAKPGVYYMRGQSRVLDMLGEAGGVRGDGVNEVRLTRAGSDGQVTVLDYDALVGEGSGNVEVAGGDIIFVPESLVYVSGEVARPGSVSYREGLTVSQAVTAAGGAAAAANLRRVYILRGEERIRVNVRRILRGQAEDVAVRAGDQVVVSESAL